MEREELLKIMEEEAQAAAEELNAWTDAANRQDSRLLKAIAEAKKEWQRAAVHHLKDRLAARLEDFGRN